MSVYLYIYESMRTHTHTVSLSHTHTHTHTQTEERKREKAKYTQRTHAINGHEPVRKSLYLAPVLRKGGNERRERRERDGREMGRGHIEC